jgi:hypothetical protein
MKKPRGLRHEGEGCRLVVLIVVYMALLLVVISGLRILIPLVIQLGNGAQ